MRDTDTRPRCPGWRTRPAVGWDEIAVHTHKRGSLVGDSPKMTRHRKTRTVRRERREARVDVRDYR